MDDTTLKISIVEQEIRLGDTVNSKLSLEIANPSGQDVTKVLYLLIPTDLVAAEDIDKISFSPAELAGEIHDDPPEGMTKFRLGAARGIAIVAGGSVTLDLADIAAVKIGAQTAQVQWGAHGTPEGYGDVTVDVMGADEVPKIIDFYPLKSVVTYNVSKDSIQLYWETSKDSVVELFRLETKLAPLAGEPPAPTKTQPYFSDTMYDGAGLQPYRLTVTAKGKTISRTVFVRVQTPGWNKIACEQGAPMTLLSDGGKHLFGIFNTANGSAIYPLDPTKGDLGQQTKMCQNGKIPTGQEKSPAVFFSNKVFVIGGSQVDASVFSKKVQVYNPIEATWTDQSENVPWSARMGHACVVYDDKLWVLGGFDANGNTLKDTYFTQDGISWQAGKPLVNPVCFHSAQAYGGDLFVYGGVNSPYGKSYPGLWRSTDGGDWAEMKFFVGSAQKSDPGFGEPVGTSMSTVLLPNQNNKVVEELKILATYSEANTANIVSGMYRLQSGGPYYLIQDKDTITELAGWKTVAGPKDTPQPFRLCSIAFSNYIFVQSILDDLATNTLTYHVS